MNTQNNTTVRVTVLGCRGSVPVSDDQMRVFGGSTSAYMIEADGGVLFLDAGSGILKAAPAMIPSDSVQLLLTHTHIDHILGMPFFLMGACRGKQLHIYGKTQNGLTVREQLSRFFSPPLWPVGLEDYKETGLYFHELQTADDSSCPLLQGPFRVWCMESAHPGGALVYRVEAKGRRIVLATDYEHGSGADRALEEFARGCDLLLYDSQYVSEEMKDKKGFGHSTEDAGLKIFLSAGGKRIRFIHHDPCMTDAQLLRREKRIQTICPEAAFAREGETVEL